jgi:hypothetical protein
MLYLDVCKFLCLWVDKLLTIMCTGLCRKRPQSQTCVEIKYETAAMRFFHSLGGMSPTCRPSVLELLIVKGLSHKSYIPLWVISLLVFLGYGALIMLTSH